MKNLKKTLLALGTAFFLLAAVFLISSSSHMVLAAGATSAQDVTDCGNSLKFVDIAHITCTTSAGKVTFTDSNPTDSGTTGSGYFAVNYAPNGIFCSKGVAGLQGYGGSYYAGVTRTGSTNNFVLSDAGKPISVKLNVGYSNPSTGQCTPMNKDFTIPGSNTQGISNLMDFSNSGNNINSLSGVTAGSLSGKGYSYVTGYSNGNTVAFQQGFNANKCSGDIIILNASDNSATRYTLNSDNQSLANYPDLLAFLTNQSAAGCYIHESQTNFGLGSGTFNVAGSAPILANATCSGIACRNTSGATGSTTTPTSTNTTNGNSCELKSNGFSLAWLLCPALEAADVFATNLMQVFEDQLPFCIQEAGAHCTALAGKAQDLGNSQSQVKQAWSIMKNMASAVLVIVMLVIVISQALGEGIIDAYSMRKMLPRLVTAAILIQLSWIIAVWVVDLVNDIGVGLGDLMAAPFGGAQNLSFGALLSQAGVGTATGGIFIGYLGGILGIAIGVAFLPSLLVAAFTAVLTLIVGLAVLIFRKILIIMLLIFSPIALISWILPSQSTQRLWKTWQENFTKVLMMFPLVVAMIETGRIFAHITGATNAATGSSFIKFWFVMAGYFLPLFILPRAYKWGGGMMSAAGGAIGGLQNSIQKAANPGIKQFGHDIYTGKKADQYDPTKGKFHVSFGRDKGKLGFAMDGRAFRRIQSGHFLPTNRSRNLTLKTGEEWSSARTAEALAYEQKVSRTFQDRGISAKQAREWNEMTARMGYDRGAVLKDEAGNDVTDSDGHAVHENDIFKAREKGVGAGKWAALALAWQAQEKDDAPLGKAVIDHLIKSKSGLEFRNRNFVLPYFDKKTGRTEIVPFFAHPKTVDRAYKEPEHYSVLGSLGGDMPPHNTPYGGNGGQTAEGYQKVYKRGIRYVRNPDGSISQNRDYNPDIARAFGIKVGQTEATAWDTRQDLKPNEHYTPSAFAAHYAQASYDDARNNMAMGGSMGGAFMNMLIDGAKRGFVQGERATDMPLKQAAWVLAEAVRTGEGRDNMKVILTDPSTREIAENMFETAGITHFRDRFGEVHKFSVQELWDSSIRDEQRIKNGEAPTVNTREETFYTERGGRVEPLYREPPIVAGGGHPDDEYPAYRRLDGTMEPAIPAAGERATAPEAAPVQASAMPTHDVGSSGQAAPTPSVATSAAQVSSVSTTVPISGVTLNLAPDQPISLQGANVTLQGVQAGQGADMYQRRQSESMHSELREIYLALKKLGVRNEAQQQQFEQLKREHPDWDREEGGPPQGQAPTA